MLHVGDITKLSGTALPPVDVVIGGSPCQDLSIAGKGVGLAGNRSGLFMEQLRIVKELRDEDRKRGRTGIFVRPRFMVWENVPGALSSNRGGDFQVVLQETIRIAQADAPDIPCPEKWSLADAYFGDGWSVAYRVLNAQFWGVPQRRRRIALIADFGGHTAPEILFVRESVQGNPEPCGAAGEGTSGRVERGTDSAGGVSGNHLRERALAIHQNQLGEVRVGEIANTLSTNGNASGRNAPLLMDTVYCLQGNGIDRADTAGCNGRGWKENASYTLNTIDRHAVAYSFDSLASNSMKSKNPQSGCREVEIAKTLDCFDPNPAKNQGGIAIVQTVYDARGNGDGENVCTLTGDHTNRVTDYTPIVPRCLTANCYKQKGRADAETYLSKGGIVRRLTPFECERLQGYPDGWTDIGEWTDSAGKVRKTSDAARYKALGNSIALPPWKWVLKRISAQYERDATLGSLFDGIGGFPLIWEQINGKDSCIWASEIEEFCIAVTKRRFQ